MTVDRRRLGKWREASELVGRQFDEAIFPNQEIRVARLRVTSRRYPVQEFGPKGRRIPSGSGAVEPAISTTMPLVWSAGGNQFVGEVPTTKAKYPPGSATTYPAFVVMPLLGAGTYRARLP